MSKTIAVLGAGKVGKLIASELSTRYSVTVLDRNEAALESMNEYPKIKTILCDLPVALNDISSFIDADIYVGAVPGWLGFETVIKLAAKGKPVVDISFFPQDARTLHKEFEKYNTFCIPDCGIAPGLSNFIAGYHERSMDVDEFICYVGGLPYDRKYPHEYVAPFSPVDVIEEYTRPARYVKEGRQVIKEPLSEPIMLTFDKIGELEAFNSDGLRSLIHTLNIPNMKEMTLRYPKHAEYMRFLQAAGFFNDRKILLKSVEVNVREFTSELLFDGWKADDVYNEFTVMRLLFSGNNKGKGFSLKYDLFDSRDNVTGFSSMARTTGYTCCAMVDLIANGAVTGLGILFPEKIAVSESIYNSVLNYLKLKGIIIDFSENWSVD